MRIGVMKDSKTKAEESTRLGYTGLRHVLCSILKNEGVVYYESRKRELNKTYE